MQETAIVSARISKPLRRLVDAEAKRRGTTRQQIIIAGILREIAPNSQPASVLVTSQYGTELNRIATRR